MNLRDLKYLVTVADKQSFSRAAQQCCVSQPALSMQIKKMEETLGVVVFDRSERRIGCTRVGTELVAKANMILKELEAFYEIAREDEVQPMDKSVLLRLRQQSSV